jgi:hypothetical protein
MRTPHDTELLLNAQRGLLGEIPPRLRAVSFDLSSDGQNLVARFEFDGEPTDDELECASVAMTNILASYSANHRSYKEEMVSNPFPNKPQFLRLVAFFRNEDEWNSWSKTFNKSLDTGATRVST